MKRDWKLIRAIVLDEQTNTWPELVVLEHIALCVDAGYVRASVLRSIYSQQVQIVRYGELWQTAKGMEVAELLASTEDLDAVLAEMNSKGVGQVSDFVFAMMRKRAEDRLKK